MSKAETFEVSFGDNKSIDVNVNFAKGDAIRVPVNINSLDAEKVASEIAAQLQLPEIDTTELAKQGENQEATNSKILEEVAKIPDLSLLYSARFEKNDDGEDTYSMVLPIVAGVIANEDGETVTIKL